MKDSNIILRISSEKKALWQGKAKAQGVTLTKYIVNMVDGNVYTNEEDELDNVYTEEKEWVGPIFKDNKLNEKVNES